MVLITLKSGRKIGVGQPCYIIAEVGSNWTSLSDCLNSIRLAKLAGADAVKFQLYTYEALYGLPQKFDDPETVKWFKKQGSLVNETKKLPGQLPIHWLPALKEAAQTNEIDFLCSAFSPKLIEAVDPYVEMHKVASSEACHVRMLETYKRIGKPVILSCGGKGESDIAKSLEVLGDTPVILCYCVAAYPSREVNLLMIQSYYERFERPVGFSDHSLDATTIPKVAVELGAVLVEKHVTFIEGNTTPDAGHSLNFDQFKLMCEVIRGKPCDPIGYTREESDMLTKHNRRIIATRDIAPGEKLEEGFNIGIYRSLKEDTKGLSPFAMSRVNGKTSLNLKRAGDSIGPDDFA